MSNQYTGFDNKIYRCCIDCQVELVSTRRWRQLTKDQRKAARKAGKACYGGNERCQACDNRVRRHAGGSKQTSPSSIQVRRDRRHRMSTLSNEEVVRLRRLVGLPDVLPKEQTR